MSFSYIDDYKQLLALAQSHLLQEYNPSDWIYSPSNLFDKLKSQRSLTPIQEQVAPLKPIQKPKTSFPLPPAPLKAVKKEPLIPLPIPVEIEPVNPKLLTSVQPSLDLSDFWKILSERFPQQQLIKEIPSPNPARRVILLSMETDPQSFELLEKMTQAITTHLAPAELVSAATIEKSNGWKTLLNLDIQLIIAPESLIQALPHLKLCYRESSSQLFLDQIPFFPLQDLVRYRQEPQLKNTLWTALRKVLKP